MMKKVLSATMIAALALSVAACGGGDKKMPRKTARNRLLPQLLQKLTAAKNSLPY